MKLPYLRIQIVNKNDVYQPWHLVETIHSALIDKYLRDFNRNETERESIFKASAVFQKPNCTWQRNTSNANVILKRNATRFSLSKQTKNSLECRPLVDLPHFRRNTKVQTFLPQMIQIIVPKRQLPYIWSFPSSKSPRWPNCTKHTNTHERTTFHKLSFENILPSNAMRS